MGRRIAYLGVAIALCFALLGTLSVTQGCYSVPQPECGFVCGPGGACPDDYTCNSADNRCHLNGSAPQQCLGGADAGIDTPDSIGVDMGSNTPPSVVSTSPTDGATGVAVTATVSATFSEEVFGVNGSTFSLTQGAQQVAATISYTSAANPVATLTPTAQLLPNTTYTATLMTSIVDAGGAALPQKTWTFTTAVDTMAPAVTNRTPAPNATNVALSSTVTAQFSEAVMGVSLTTFTLADGANAIAGSVTYTAATRTATFTPTGSLPAGRTLTATLTSGITDTSSNALSGAPVTWTFTTVADTTAPTVQTRMPGPGATAVSTATNIVVLFDEPVMNVTATTFTVNDGAAVTGTLTSAMSGREWTFTPSAALTPNVSVTVTLTTGIADLAGNALAAPVTWMFTTAPDTTAPTVTMRTPAPNATMVATGTTIVATFSEPVMGVTTSTFTVNNGSAVAGSLASTMGGRVWTFTPTAALPNNSTVTVTLTTGISDLAGNALASAVSWMFTTAGDTTAPTVMTRTPAPNATMVPSTSTIVVTFSEAVMNVTALTFTVNNGSAVSGTITSSNGNKTWTFSSLSGLGSNVTVNVTLATGITDLAGNPLASAVTWMFTTIADTTAPTIVSTLPVTDQANVATTSGINVNFSEPVTGVTTASFSLDDGTTVAGNVAVSNGGMTWTFIPSSPLAAGVVVTVRLTTAITDIAGNPLAAAYTYNFSTAGSSNLFGPTINSTVPTNGINNVPTSTTIAVTFSEPVVGVNATSFTVDTTGPVAGSRTVSGGGTVWTFTPSAALPGGTLVTVTLTTSIVDLEGNGLSAPVTFTFTTQ